jgi:hypothetical protein
MMKGHFDFYRLVGNLAVEDCYLNWMGHFDLHCLVGSLAVEDCYLNLMGHFDFYRLVGNLAVEDCYLNLMGLQVVVEIEYYCSEPPAGVVVVMMIHFPTMMVEDYCQPLLIEDYCQMKLVGIH